MVKVKLGSYLASSTCTRTVIISHLAKYLYGYVTVFQGMKCLAGIKPCLLFTGDAFEQEDEYIRLKNLLIGKKFITQHWFSLKHICVKHICVKWLETILPCICCMDDITLK